MTAPSPAEVAATLLRAKKRAYDRDYYRAHRERLNERARARRALDRERINAYQRERYAVRRDEGRAWHQSQKRSETP